MVRCVTATVNLQRICWCCLARICRNSAEVREGSAGLCGSDGCAWRTRRSNSPTDRWEVRQESVAGGTRACYNCRCPDNRRSREEVTMSKDSARTSRNRLLVRRCSATLGSVIVMTLLAGHASAFAFGPTSVSHDGSVRGWGQGQLYPVGWDLRLESSLRDMQVDSMRTYAEGQANRGTSLHVKVQSGRRSEGGSSWATMATKTAPAGGSMAGSYATTKVCMDRAWVLDPCAASASQWW